MSDGKLEAVVDGRETGILWNGSEVLHDLLAGRESGRLRLFGEALLIAPEGAEESDPGKADVSGAGRQVVV